MDDTTLITQTAAPLPQVSDRRDVFARRVQLFPVQQLTPAPPALFICATHLLH